METKELLYKKLNALRLEVDGSIVDDIKKTVDELFLPLSKESDNKFEEWLEEIIERTYQNSETENVLKEILAEYKRLSAKEGETGK